MEEISLKPSSVQDSTVKSKSVNLLQIYFDNVCIFKAVEDRTLEVVLRKGKQLHKWLKALKVKNDEENISDRYLKKKDVSKNTAVLDKDSGAPPEEEPDIVLISKNFTNIIETNPNPSGSSVTIPRFIILLGLEAARRGIAFHSLLQCKVDTSNCPHRLTKFTQLMLDGFFYVGRMIELSLLNDPVVNNGNPFEFEKGDLGFWWATVIIMDWLSYCNTLKTEKKQATVREFNQMNLARYGMNERMAGLHMQRASCYFLSAEDLNNFNESIDNVRYKVATQKQKKQGLENTTDEIDEIADIFKKV